LLDDRGQVPLVVDGYLVDEPVEPRCHLSVRPHGEAGCTDWDDVRAAWQLGVEQHPVAVVLARSGRDLVATVRTAGAAGLRAAAQATGHNAAPAGPAPRYGPAEHFALLRQSKLRTPSEALQGHDLGG
jgi:hypothetical protein